MPPRRNVRNAWRENAPNIRGIVTANEPTTLKAAILLAGSLTDGAVRDGTLTKKGMGEKRKWNEGTRRKTTSEYDKKPTTARNFVAVTHDRKPYTGPRPRCNRCNLQHPGNCQACP
ncbi:hypothetical protein L1987_70762 [Smallanthus sonchifolius]|uniref:Uncharacterized protein n=1 Tax=Smallanthus sonchifolius TaxID=185202 RepID=A0ACB9ARX1_9ASTR|nr:hypothetical protein L1987_70762 [Smallanthus sonchifolius]